MQSLHFLFTVLAVISVTYGQQPDRCLLDVEAGRCVGDIPRWFFNREQKCCDEFMFTGCLGNKNNFATYSDCLNECVYYTPELKEEEEEAAEEEEGGEDNKE